MSLPVHKSYSPSPQRPLVVGVVAGLPWCCIAPAVASVLGASSGILALTTSLPVKIALLVVSLGSLGRANYLVWIRRHGPKWVRLVTAASTLLVILAWTYRLAWLAQR